MILMELPKGALVLQRERPASAPPPPTQKGPPMVKKKSNAKLGGARPGAGRPATGRKQNLTIRFPPKLHEQLTDTAEDLGLSVSAYVQQIVEAELG